MLTRVVRVRIVFIPISRVWTFRYQCRSGWRHFEPGTEVSRDISVLMPKCPETLQHWCRIGQDTPDPKRWYRNGLIPKCLGTEVSGNLQFPCTLQPRCRFESHCCSVLDKLHVTLRFCCCVPNYLFAYLFDEYFLQHLLNFVSHQSGAILLLSLQSGAVLLHESQWISWLGSSNCSVAVYMVNFVVR